MSETALAIAKDYPQDKYNLLIPVRTMQELSPLHKLVINEVQISTNLADKDVYQEKNKEYALTKKALMKLMAAANIQIIDSCSVPTQKCNKCIEIAQRTRQAPKCFECPYQDDVAYTVTVAVPEPSGTYRMIKATKEIRMEDSKGSMTDAQFKQFKPFRTEQCESKALNRALREGLMLKSSYAAQELKKPFAVALVMPNMADPDLKKAMVERYANNASALYGGGQSSAQIQGGQMDALPQETTVILADDEIDFETGEVIDISIEEPELKPEPVVCSLCRKELKPFTDRNKKNWSIEDTVDYSMGRCNQVLCIGCAVKEIKKQKAKEKAGDSD